MTKGSVCSPRAGGRHSRDSVLVQCGSVPPSQAPQPRRDRARPRARASSAGVRAALQSCFNQAAGAEAAVKAAKAAVE